MPGVPGQVLKEIIESEFLYNDCLQLLRRNFFENIQKLEHQQDVDIFTQFIASFDFIVSIHKELTNTFRQAYYHPITNRPLSVPEMFENRVQVVEALLKSNNDFYFYQPYLGSFSSFTYDFFKLDPKHPLRQLVARQEQNPELKGQTFESLLIMPVQRIPRYLLLVNALIKELPSEDSCSAILHMLQSNLEKLGDKCNEKIGEYEDTIAMLRIFEQFNRDARIIANKRKLVCRSEMKKVNNRNIHPISHTVETTFVLFNDVFIYARRNGENLEISNIFELRNCAFLFDLPSEYPSNSFMVFSPIKSFSILCNDEYEFKQWRDKVTQTMEAIRKTSSRRFISVSKLAKNASIKTCLSLECQSDSSLPKAGFYQCSNCCRVVCKACFDSWRKDDTCTLCTEEQEAAAKVARQEHQDLLVAHEQMRQQQEQMTHALDAETQKSASYYFQWKEAEKRQRNQEQQLVILSRQYKSINERLLFQLGQHKQKKQQQLEYVRGLRDDNFAKCYRIDRLTQDLSLSRKRFDDLAAQHVSTLKQLLQVPTDFVPPELEALLEQFKTKGAASVLGLGVDTAVPGQQPMSEGWSLPACHPAATEMLTPRTSSMTSEHSLEPPFASASAQPPMVFSSSSCEPPCVESGVASAANAASSSGSASTSVPPALPPASFRTSTPRSPSFMYMQMVSASPQPMAIDLERQMQHVLERNHHLEEELHHLQSLAEQPSEGSPEHQQQQQVQQLKDQIRQLQAQRDEFESKYNCAADESRQIQQEYLNTMRDLDLQREKEEAMGELQESYAAESAANGELERRVESLTQQLERERQDFESALSERSSEFEQERASISQEYESQIEKLNADFQSLIEEQNLQMQELREKCAEETALRRKLHNELIDVRGNIRVFCRVRPPLAFELAKGQSEIVPTFPNPFELQFSHDYHAYHYDFERTFPPRSTQEEVFVEVEPFIVSVLDGFNVCIFAYGQTGSGKTYTMEGPEGNHGVNFRALKTLFRLAEDRRSITDYTFTISVIEIYNEKINDLLKAPTPRSGIRPPTLSTSPSPSPTTPGDKAPSGDKYMVMLEQISSMELHSYEEANSVIESARSIRKTASHSMNETSSRSHLIVHLVVRATSSSDGSTRECFLNLVDLAGSERASKTESEGDRLAEANSINRSLSALGDVIAAKVNKQTFIPFRNSMLTYYLKDSFTDNAKVLMFVNVNPLREQVSETLSSLNFATRCREVTVPMDRPGGKPKLSGRSLGQERSP